MSENRTRILEMLAENKITVDEAERLLAVAGNEETTETSYTPETTGNKQLPKYLRVVVTPGPGSTEMDDVDKVNVRVPMNLIRAGMKLTSLIPPHASDKMNEAMREKGVDFDLRNMKPEDLEELINALSDLEVDVEGKTMVRVFAE
ncbi:hypothetical protein ACFLXY_01920 [Chloroflexota bacterium]